MNDLLKAFQTMVTELERATDMDEVQDVLDDHYARIERLFVNSDEDVCDLITQIGFLK